MNKPSFIHLRVHSEYSVVDGLVRLNHLFKKLTDIRMPACALTDEMNQFAAVKFYQDAKKAGIKPIFGADVWILCPKHTHNPFRATFLCQNAQGFRHLTELISESYLDPNRKDIPVIARESLTPDKCSGLIMLSGAHEGELAFYLSNQRTPQAYAEARVWQELLPGRFYIELQRMPALSRRYEQDMIALARSLNLPLVATNNVRFLAREDYDAHEARVCIHDGSILSDPKRAKKYFSDQYLKTPAEMAVLFQDLPDALQNTVEIAKRCTVDLVLGKTFLPDFPVPPGYTTETYFAEESHKGLKLRIEKALNTTKALDEKLYLDRLDEEVKVIGGMGFAGYFLIVADFIRYAKTAGIPVGPGRGSGAGSLVAYALQITDLDPIPYDLLFERFLNPERVSMPDFDIDFCMDGRDKVIAYVTEKYGHHAVSQIITFGTMAAKAVVRDCGRVMGYPYGFVDKLAKLIPFEIGITLDKALTDEPQLQARYDEDAEVKALIDLALKLEGTTRNVGKHAGGVVIAPSRLTDFTPIYCERGSTHLVSQFDKDDIESIGLVKFDFLGLRTLTIIDWAVKAINQKRAKTDLSLIDIQEIPLTDKKTFQLLKSAETTAIFQLESRGMKDLIRRLQPDHFEDIVALVALFRPGPLQSGMVDDFINRKHGRAQVSYPHASLAPILSPTYGVILYQEQVMQIAQVLAGYTLGGADLLRRAMGKKKVDEMAEQREIFVKGATENAVDHTVAAHIFDLMEKFAGYGFNKSHSAAYALVSYQTAWLKAHYPAEFMAAVLSADLHHTDKVVQFLEECKNMKLKVLPPHVNHSDVHFKALDATHISYGLGAVKGAGEGGMDIIVQAREGVGEFQSLFHLCRCIEKQKVNRRHLEALIKAGACDGLGAHRASMLASVAKALQATPAHAALQDDLFAGGMPDPVFENVPAWGPEAALEYERETLGFYSSGHILNLIYPILPQGSFKKLIHISLRLNKAFAPVQIQAIKVITTKKDKKMAVLTVCDEANNIREVVLYPDTFEEFRLFCVKDTVVLVEIEASEDRFTQKMRLTVKSIVDIEAFLAEKTKKITIQLREAQESDFQRLSDVLTVFKTGNTKIRVKSAIQDAPVCIDLPEEWNITPKKALFAALHEAFEGCQIFVE